VPARSQDIRRPHTRLRLRPAHAVRRHTNTLVAARLQQRQPFSSTDGAAIWRPCVLCRRAPCVESAADGTETHAVIDNNIQASPKDIPVQLSTLLPLTIECAFGLIVGGALQKCCCYCYCCCYCWDLNLGPLKFSAVIAPLTRGEERAGNEADRHGDTIQQVTP